MSFFFAKYVSREKTLTKQLVINIEQSMVKTPFPSDVSYLSTNRVSRRRGASMLFFMRFVCFVFEHAGLKTATWAAG